MSNTRPSSRTPPVGYCGGSGSGRSVPEPAQYPVPAAAALLHSDWTAKREPWLPRMSPIAPGIGVTVGSPGAPRLSPTHAHLSPFSLASTESYQPPRVLPLMMSSAPGSVTVSSISWPRTIENPSSLPAASVLTAFSPHTLKSPELMASAYGMFVHAMPGVRPLYQPFSTTGWV